MTQIRSGSGFEAPAIPSLPDPPLLAMGPGLAESPVPPLPPIAGPYPTSPLPPEAPLAPKVRPATEMPRATESEPTQTPPGTIVTWLLIIAIVAVLVGAGSLMAAF